MSNWAVIILVVLGASLVTSIILFGLIIRDFWMARRSRRSSSVS